MTQSDQPSSNNTPDTTAGAVREDNGRLNPETPPTAEAPSIVEPPRTGEAAQIESVRAHVASLRQALIESGLSFGPTAQQQAEGVPSGAEALQALIPELETAVREMEALKASVQARTDAASDAQSNGDPSDAGMNPDADSGPGSRKDLSDVQDLLHLQAELSRAAHLTQHGSQFWQGWAGLLGLDTGYTPAGVVAPISGRSTVIPHKSSISVEG